MGSYYSITVSETWQVISRPEKRTVLSRRSDPLCSHLKMGYPSNYARMAGILLVLHVYKPIESSSCTWLISVIYWWLHQSEDTAAGKALNAASSARSANAESPRAR